MTKMAGVTWTITPLSDNQELVAGIYDELVLNYPNLPANNHWSYIRPLLSHFYQESQVFIAVARNEQKVFTAIPLVLSKQQKFIYRWIEFGLPFHKHMNLISIPRVTENEITDILLKLEQAIQQLPLKWHRLAIRNILLDAKVGPDLVSDNTVFEFSDDSAWFNTSINNGPESVISKKLVKNLKRLQKKMLTIDDDCQLLEASSTDEIKTALLSFRSIEEISWKGNEGVAINSSDELISFYSKLVTEFSLSKQARIFHYGSEDKIYASALGFLLGDSLYIHKISFDQKFMDVAPGSLLIFEIIKKSLLDDQINKVSLVTYPDWAKRWHPQSASAINYIKYNNSIAGRSLQAAVSIWRGSKPFIKRLRSKLQQLTPG
ncbi:MAG: GNAT family N-acetyltransferase [Oleispira sp.]|nr:GNAT family N-acetyltransferase [Oleispira sp.]MBL4880089.1 GNAT family N-acetyltransferase [Oleispira sp.]